MASVFFHGTGKNVQSRPSVTTPKPRRYTLLDCMCNGCFIVRQTLISAGQCCMKPDSCIDNGKH